MVNERTLKQISLLVMRLERLSADSTLAHRASGLRGSLLHFLERYEADLTKIDQTELSKIVAAGYLILEQAAKRQTQRTISQEK